MTTRLPCVGEDVTVDGTTYGWVCEVYDTECVINFSYGNCTPNRYRVKYDQIVKIHDPEAGLGDISKAPMAQALMAMLHEKDNG